MFRPTCDITAQCGRLNCTDSPIKICSRHFLLLNHLTVVYGKSFYFVSYLEVC